MHIAYFTIVRRIGVLLCMSFLLTSTVFALSVPSIAPVKSPFKGVKQTITGTAEIGSKIVVTGGPFQIAPVDVDAKGAFSITLSLTENHENVFYVASQKGGQMSAPVTISILEDAAAARAASTLHNQDYIAPDAPIVDVPKEAVDAYYYTIDGEAESGVLIRLSGDANDTIKVGSNGKFAMSVQLKQQKENVFYLEALDDAGNLSPKAILKVLEQGESKDQDDVRTIIDETAGDNASSPSIAEPFVDTIGHPLFSYIETLRKKGVLRGYSDGTFRPDSFMTRAELLKVCMLAFSMNVPDVSSSAPFLDTPRLSWYTRFIEAAKEEKIVTGYADGTFRPESFVNRAEAMKMILNTGRIPYDLNPQGEYLFSDVAKEDSDLWYYPFIFFMKQNGIVLGYGDGSLRPENFVTRAELATMIVRTLAYQEM